MRILRSIAIEHKRLAALIALSIVMMTAAIVVAFGDGNRLPTRANFVCVATGERFDLIIADIGVIPARHPSTKRRTLLPCAIGESGALEIDEHYRAVLVGRLAEINQIIDAETLRVNDASRIEE